MNAVQDHPAAAVCYKQLIIQDTMRTYSQIVVYSSFYLQTYV